MRLQGGAGATRAVRVRVRMCVSAACCAPPARRCTMKPALPALHSKSGHTLEFPRAPLLNAPLTAPLTDPLTALLTGP